MRLPIVMFCPVCRERTPAMARVSPRECKSRMMRFACRCDKCGQPIAWEGRLGEAVEETIRRGHLACFAMA